MGFALIEQGMVDLLGRDDFSLAFLLVEDGVIKRLAFIENGDIFPSVLADCDLGLMKSIRGTIRLDLVDGVLELDGQVFGNTAGLLPGENVVQVLCLQHGPMGIQGRTGLSQKDKESIMKPFL